MAPRRPAGAAAVAARAGAPTDLLVTGLDPGLARYAQDPGPYRDACADGTPDWLDELELRPAPPHHRMGTRALDLAAWFVVDAHRDAELALRRRLLTERANEVFAALPSAEAASAELLELIGEWAAARRTPRSRAR